jgi:hypothetical protein
MADSLHLTAFAAGFILQVKFADPCDAAHHLEMDGIVPPYEALKSLGSEDMAKDVK